MDSDMFVSLLHSYVIYYFDMKMTRAYLLYANVAYRYNPANLWALVVFK